MTAPTGRAACDAQPAMRDPLRGELVGMEAGIVRSRNPGIAGASGTVVRETQNMLVLLPPRARRGRGAASNVRGAGIAGAGEFMEAAAAGAGRLPDGRGPYRSYPKAGSVWRFAAAGASAEIDGSLIAQRPEDRLRARPRPATAAGASEGGARG